MRWNLAVAGLAASWGFIAVIVAGVDLDAEVLVFYRLALAALALTVGLVAARRLDLLRLPLARRRTLAVAVGLAAHWLLFFLTIKLASVAVAVLTVYTAPILLSVLAPLLLPEARSTVALLALVPASLGLVLIALGGEEGSAISPIAIVTGLSAALTYALLVIGTKQLGTRLPVATIAVWLYGVAALALAPLLVRADRVLPHAEEIPYLLLLGVLFTAASGLTYVWLLRRVTAQAVGVLGYLEPVSAALLAWAILAQPLNAAVVLGGALVLAGGLLVVLAEPRTAALEAPAAR